MRPSINAASRQGFRDVQFEADVHASRQLLNSASCTLRGASTSSSSKSAASAQNFRHRPSTAAESSSHSFTSFRTPLFQRVFDNAALEHEAREERKQKRERHAALAAKYIPKEPLSPPLSPSSPSPPTPPPLQRCHPISRPSTAIPRALHSQHPKLRALYADLRHTTSLIQDSLRSDPAPPLPSSASARWLAKHGYAPPPAPSADELQRYEEIFRTLDEDESGALTVGELRAALGSLRLPLSEEEVRRLMAEMDRNGDDTITLAEFTTAMTRKQGEEEWDSIEQIRRDRRHPPRTANSNTKRADSPTLLPFSLWVPAWSRRERFAQVMEAEPRAVRRLKAQQADERSEQRHQNQERLLRSARGARSTEPPARARSRVPTAFSAHSYVARTVEPVTAAVESTTPSHTPPRSPLMGRRMVAGTGTGDAALDVRWVRDEEARDDAGSLAWQWAKVIAAVPEPEPVQDDTSSLQQWKVQRALAARLPEEPEDAAANTKERQEREGRLLARVTEQLRTEVEEEDEDEESHPVPRGSALLKRASHKFRLGQRREEELAREVEAKSRDAIIESVLEEADAIIANSRAARNGTPYPR